MASKVYIIGLPDLTGALEEMQRIIKEEPELITAQLADSMRKFAHERTGHLLETIYHKGLTAGASASYAGHEADRGGDHDFAQRAIDDFDMERYSDNIVAPF